MRIYEDDITGANSYERILKLSAEYEMEQKELTYFLKTEQARSTLSCYWKSCKII